MNCRERLNRGGQIIHYKTQLSFTKKAHTHYSNFKPVKLIKILFPRHQLNICFHDITWKSRFKD